MTQTELTTKNFISKVQAEEALCIYSESADLFWMPTFVDDSAVYFQSTNKVGFFASINKMGRFFRIALDCEDDA